MSQIQRIRDIQRARDFLTERGCTVLGRTEDNAGAGCCNCAALASHTIYTAPVEGFEREWLHVCGDCLISEVEAHCSHIAHPEG